MVYILEISQRDITPYAQECPYKGKEGHNAEGTGPDCTSDCRWLEGDVRELRSPEMFTAEMDDDDREVYGSPVAWAAHYLSAHHPEITESSAGMTETFDAQWRSHVPAHAWLSGEYETDAYNPESRTETTVRLTGEFDTCQRSKVFALAVLPYDRMMTELRERNEGGK